MIKTENTQVVGWEAAIRGMRNPMNSWDKSDSLFIPASMCDTEDYDLARMCHGIAPIIKEKDMNLMKKLRDAGTDHRKYMRMITVYADITAPLYWWKEFDTYKVGTVANSCSTMHTIHKKPFTIDDFSAECLFNEYCVADGWYECTMEYTINALNHARGKYLETKDKKYWWQMIQLLPTSYNQKRTVMMNYEVLCNMYHARKNHKLDEWKSFCKWMERLPYGKELIVG